MTFKGDITQWFVDGFSDAPVNSANKGILGGGGGDGGTIPPYIGPQDQNSEKHVIKFQKSGFGIRCPTGEAKITLGFKLPASHVIHTVGPIYDVDSNPEASLRSANTNSLSLPKRTTFSTLLFLPYCVAHMSAFRSIYS